jgi:cytochrome c5
MSATVNAILGTLFLVLAFGTVFLMYRLWGYPFDKIRRKSAAPPGLMRLHRMLGYAYLIVYVVLMTQMVPRLWTYQVEFPPRTVLHIALGFTIGLILIVKISIVRFFRHFEEWMPILGTALLVCTVLLTGFSIPFAVRERVLAAQAFSADNLARVVKLLPDAGFATDTKLEQLATADTLRLGQQVLTSQCNVCHDLRTVLVKPRVPSDWVQTVARMVEKPNPGRPISRTSQDAVATYLIAITPDLQASVEAKRRQDASAPAPGTATDPKALFEKTCSQCHDAKLVEAHAFKSEKDVRDLVSRMVKNGLKLDQASLERIIQHLKSTYVK